METLYYIVVTLRVTNIRQEFRKMYCLYLTR